MSLIYSSVCDWFFTLIVIAGENCFISVSQLASAKWWSQYLSAALCKCSCMDRNLQSMQDLDLHLKARALFKPPPISKAWKHYKQVKGIDFRI